VRPVIQIAAITGWRIKSEVLPLEWRQVDFKAGEVRLDPGTTKNGDGRVFAMTQQLRRVLETQHAEHQRLKKAGTLEPWVFFRMVAEGRGGPVKPQRIIAFANGWKAACRAAGCPGRLPHDLRRTAVRNLVRSGIPERVAMQMTGDTRRAACSSATTSSARAISGTPLASSTLPLRCNPSPMRHRQPPSRCRSRLFQGFARP
jgi:integrase